MLTHTNRICFCGIGEYSSYIRENICEWLGAELHAETMKISRFLKGKSSDAIIYGLIDESNMKF